MDQDTGDLLEYRQLAKHPKYRDTWTKAFGKEIGRLAQGQKGIVEGTNAIFFIPFDDIPIVIAEGISPTLEYVQITDRRRLIPTESGSRLAEI